MPYDKLAAGGRVLFWSPINGYDLWSTDGTAGGTQFAAKFAEKRFSDAVVGGVTYFFARPTGVNTPESLWRTDGTAAGTWKLKELLNESAGQVRACGQDVYFSTVVGSRSRLWRSDGTAEGTVLVKEFESSRAPLWMTAYKGRVYFSAADSAAGTQFWSTDGTPEGTQVFRSDVVPAAAMTEAKGLLYFSGGSANQGAEPWRTDGTPAGTIQLKDIEAGNFSSSPGSFTEVAGAVLFLADDSLWKTDGTTAGTQQVRLAGFNYLQFPRQLVALGGRAYFTAGLSGQGVELWTSDGTQAGTRMAVDLVPGTGEANIDSLRSIAGRLFFTTRLTTTGNQLWTSDGTQAGTRRLADYKHAAEIVGSGDRAFFTADEGYYGREVYVSDGTFAGTRLAGDAMALPLSADPVVPLVVNHRYYVAATGPLGARTWWSTDGTAEGTVDTGVIKTPTEPHSAQVLGTSLVYYGHSPGSSYQLFATDGSVAGTQSLGVAPGDFRTDPYMTEYKGKLYLSGSQFPDHGIFETRGTPDSTSRLAVARGAVTGIATTDEWLFLAYHDYQWTGEIATLYRSDGTSEGTVPLLRRTEAEAGSYFTDLTSTGRHLFFTQTKPGSPTPVAWTRLYRTDGTPGGEVLLMEQSPGSLHSFFPLGERVFFVGPGNQYGLWVTDGTARGTTKVKDFAPGDSAQGKFNGPVPIAALGDRLLFTASDGASGTELWITDGTPGGTTRVKDIRPGASGSLPVGLAPAAAVFNGWLYFAADDGVSGVELWQTDGTEAGTQRVSDINPGAAGSDPGALAAVGKWLVFAATEPARGRELWRVADLHAPKALSAVFHHDRVSHELIFSFNEHVGASLTPQDIVLRNRSTGSLVSPSQIHLDYDEATHAATFTFPGFPSGVLPDGNYTAFLASDRVADPGGNALADEIEVNFVVLSGDADGDGRVGIADYFAIDRGRALRLSGWANGDFNRSGGRPDADDYMIIDRAFPGLAADSASGGLSLGRPQRAVPVLPAAFPASPFATEPIDDENVWDEHDGSVLDEV